MQNTTKQLRILLRIFNDFKELSGLTINIGKTKYVKFGITPETDVNILDSPFDQEKENTLSYLG